MKLYDITDSYLNVLELLEETNDVSQSEFGKALEVVEAAFEDKAEAIAKIIKNYETENEAIDIEIKRLQNRKSVNQNKANGVKKYLEDNMITTGKTKFKTDLFSFGIQKNPPSANITNESLIPDKFWKVERSVMKSEILKAIKDGVEVPGAELKQTEGLRIR